MSSNPGRLAALRKLLCSWYAPALLGVLLLLGAFALWVWPGIGAPWDENLGRAVLAWWRPLLLLGVLLAVLMAVVWYAHGWLIARATAARFFLASVLLHLLLVFLLGAVSVGRGILRQAREMREGEIALAVNGPERAGTRDPQAHERLPDPEPVDSSVADPLRAVIAVPELPEATEVSPTALPVSLSRPHLPQRRKAELQPEVLALPGLARRPVQRNTPIEPEPEVPVLPPAVPPVPDRPIDGQPDLDLARQDRLLPAPGQPAIPRRLRPLDASPRMPEPVPEAPPVIADLPPLPLLKNRQRPQRLPEVARIEEKAEPTLHTVGYTPREKSLPGPIISLPRRKTAPDRIPVPSPGVAEHPQPEARPVLGHLDPPPREGLPDIAPLEFSLKRHTAGGTPVAPIPERFALRQEREKSVSRYGGTDATEEAVERGLDWLAAHQNPDGSWSLNNFPARCRKPACTGAAGIRADTGATGLAVLPFLGAGYTHQVGKHRQTVERALTWLIEHQGADGALVHAGEHRPLYGHGIAAIVLCEAYGMTRDPRLREPAQRALDYTVRVQHGATGGWRYTPGQPADTSVTGWHVMALRSGEMAGLTVPRKVFDGVRKWLATVDGKGPRTGQFGYQTRGDLRPGMTAQGLLCLQLLGTRRDDPRMKAGADFLLKNLPQKGRETSYYWYHATQVLFHMQGNYWKPWNDRLRDLLVSGQATKGCASGSWAPDDARERTGGRLYATSLRLLMLEVYYRHLPLYQQLNK
jgi:Prenyltransferase and squalene oxidase repeat